MEHHPHSPKVDAQPTPLPNQPFFSWLWDHTALFVSQIVAILGFVSFFASLVYYVSGSHVGESHGSEVVNPNAIQVWVDYAHIVFLGIFIVVLIYLLDINDRGSYRASQVYSRVFNEALAPIKRDSLLGGAKAQLRRFKRYFLLFWLSMLALYISFALKHNFQAVPSNENLLIRAHLAPLGQLFFPFLTFALNNVSMLFVFMCFTVLYSPSHTRQSRKKQRRMANYAKFVVALLTLSFWLLLLPISTEGFRKEDLTGYVAFFDALSGTLNALVLALLIARLDSKLIGLPSWLICVLYLYSAVQPLFVVFEQPGYAFEVIQTFVLIIVFLLKIYFFLIIVYVLQTGRVLNYLFCFPFLSKRVDSVFENQFEIRVREDPGHSFVISIFKRNALVYRDERHHVSRRVCDKRVRELREIAKASSSYRHEQECGTYWVKVVGPEQVVCESTGLRSEDEASELISESVESIPYCKYDRG
jgi:hypothetical protein